MHFSELTAPEQRVLGCLIEKRWTTPDQYPLSINALRLAANQSTNRDPVTRYDEHTVREAAQRLSRYGLARLASGHSSRAIKYRHLAEEALGLGREELAVLAVLLLRGPQTPGEIKSRTERMASIASLEHVDELLGALAQRGHARRLHRRPGQKEDRFEHLLGGDAAASDGYTVEVVAPSPGPRPQFSAVAPTPSPGPAVPGANSAAAVAPASPGSAAARPASSGTAAAPGPAPPGAPAHRPPAPADASDNGLALRVRALEEEVAALRSGLDALRSELGIEPEGDEAQASG
jgi:uncharacterized protein YceH (UPF0502 family)